MTTVTFVGYIRKIAGVRQQYVAAPDVKGLLEKLSELYGTKWRRMVFDGHGLVNGITIMVNGTSIHRLKGLATELHSGDEVIFLPQFEGG